MTVSRFAMPACAALAIALAGCSGSGSDDAASRTSETETRRADDAMRNASDGSAAAAVGDMMNDPAIRDQLGMPGSAPAVQSPPTTSPAADGTGAAGIGTGDTGQAQALAACQALKGARAGMPGRPDADAIAQAGRDLATDPNALGSCQATM